MGKYKDREIDTPQELVSLWIEAKELEKQAKSMLDYCKKSIVNFDNLELDERIVDDYGITHVTKSLYAYDINELMEACECNFPEIHDTLKQSLKITETDINKALDSVNDIGRRKQIQELIMFTKKDTGKKSAYYQLVKIKE